MKYRYLRSFFIAMFVVPAMAMTAHGGSLSLKQGDWQQISPPRDMQNITLRLFTQDYLDASDYTESWVVFKLLDSGTYLPVSLDEPLLQGRGYWILNEGAEVEIPLPGGAKVTPDQSLASCAGDCFGTSIAKRPQQSLTWDMLGYPYEFAQPFGDTTIITETGACSSGCSPSQAAAAGQVADTLFTYDGSQYRLLSSASELQPWQAFWVANQGDSPAQLVFDNPIQTPLIGYWPLDDGSGLSASDASHNDSAGTLSENLWGAGQQAGGVCLSAQPLQQIVAVDGAVPNPATLTLSAWIKPTLDIEKWGWIAGFGDSAGLYIKRDGSLVMYIWDGTTWPSLNVIPSQLPQSLYDGDWHHVVGSYDPQAGFSIHVDGVNVGSAAATDEISYAMGTEWRIGSMQGERNFSGCIDEVRAYAGLLSPAEVQLLANQTGGSVDPVSNSAPQVTLSGDQTIVLPQASVSVEVQVTDDGRPADGQLSARWVQSAGASVALPAVDLNASGLTTSVFTFDQAGTYEFELIADDTEKQSSGSITITVAPQSGGAGSICITEFQAADQDVLADEALEFPDWIELHNPGNSAVSLANWCLTDKADEPNQWCFESGSIEGNGYLVVFASNNDRQSPNYHTNFKLGKGGEYLGIFNPSGQEVCSVSPEYPQQYDYLSYGDDAQGDGAYFSEPTPGAANADASIVVPLAIGPVADVTMEVGEVLPLSVSISGLPLDSLDFSASVLPEFVELGAFANGELELIASSPAEAGVYGVTVAVANEWFDDSQTFLITVGDVDPQVPPSLCVTEFMAADQAVIMDENGVFPDWIELHNPGDSTLSLSGWCLTDTAGEPGQWCFDSGTLGADEYLVLFASGDDKQGPPAHSNFKLGKGGEYLGVFNPAGQPVCEYSPEYPGQFDDVSYGRDASGEGAYFGNPTPGAANDDSSIDTPFELGDLADVSMDVGEVRVVQVEASGDEPSAVSFDGSELPSFATLTDNQDGTASVRLAPVTAGDYEITVNATSGVFSESVSFMLSASSAMVSLDSVDQMELNWGGKPLLLDDANDRLFLSLGETHSVARTLEGALNYRHSTSGYGVRVDGVSVAAGASYSANVQHGDVLNLVVTRNGSTIWNFDVVITNLPIIEIFAEEIVDEPKLPGTARWVDGSIDFDSGTVNLGIEHRGVSALRFDKKPFGLEFREEGSEDGQNIQLLGLRNDDDWIADAAFRDQSFARNIVTHDLYREMRSFAYIDDDGVEQGQSTVAGGMAELILNGRYHGVYVIHERIDRKLLSLEKITVPEDESGERWDLVDFDDPANGSVLYKAARNRADLTADSAVEFEQKYPDTDDIDYFDALDALIEFTNESSDAEFVASVEDIVNFDSLIDYWLITLVTANRDALWKNYYLARNRDSKWFFVPWDYDATFGMTYLGGEDESSDRSYQFDKSHLLVRIDENPALGFYQKARTRWLALRNSIFTPDAIAARFIAYEEQLNRAAGSSGKSPRQRNLDRWPDTGNNGASQPELGQSSYIRAWLTRRFAYVDNKLEELAGN